MPRKPCIVCDHPDRETIEAALRAGSPSLRVLEKRFGINKTSLHRHQHHGDVSKARANVGQIEKIDEQIKRLKKAETLARKRKDTATALSIAKELRNWFTLRVKAEAVQSLDSEKNEPPPMDKAEALQISMVLIDGELSGGKHPELYQWLQELSDRVRHHYSDQSEPTSEEPSHDPV